MDGICGMVGDVFIMLDFVLCFGYVVGKVLVGLVDVVVGLCLIVLIGKDMCVLGYMFEVVFEVGFLVVGVDVMLVGLMLIFGVVYLMCVLCLLVGVVISVLYNLYYDNGIKFFLVDGNKLLDDIEVVIEVWFDKLFECVVFDGFGKVCCFDDVVGCYIEFCKSMFLVVFNLCGLKFVIDCVYGVVY